MHPDVWAAATWQTIHAVAMGYPRDPTELQRQAYRTFFAACLGEVLPCGSCAASYRRFMLSRGGRESLDAALASDSLFEWTVALHNAVNAELGKPGGAWSVERARVAVLNGGREGGVHSTARQPLDVLVPTWQAMAVGFVVAAVVVALARWVLSGCSGCSGCSDWLS